MQPRLDHFSVAPKAFAPMLAMEKYLSDCALEHSLIELVKMRASQINGCAYCVHMHAKEARAAGETEQRLHLLNAWQESSLYTDRERAALAWTEALTNLVESRAPDHIYEEVSKYFTPEEQVQLTVAITQINAWNRIAVGFRATHPAE
ncbi:MAG: carboxymuconolactone decarboxylase family protein [Alphaproteobacteria bacterium]|nr:carboxymuconolactone decarboxylase family protein [Alphaproteobacteria bacterium]